MTRLLVALAAIGTATSAAAQYISPELAAINRKYTTYSPTPEYSVSARARHLEGSGLFMLHLRPDGSVQYVEVLKGTGQQELDEACVSAYKRWRFRQNIAARAKKLKMPVTFKMDSH
jgi:TonB family protein